MLIFRSFFTMTNVSDVLAISVCLSPIVVSNNNMWNLALLVKGSRFVQFMVHSFQD